MFNHPLVSLWFFLGFSFSLLTSNSFGAWGIHFAIFLGIAWMNKNHISRVGTRLKPILLYFPVMLGLYVLFSILLTDNSLGIIFSEVVIGFLKLILMVGAMMFFFVSTPSQDIIILFRSIWIKWKKPWKGMEDFFLFLGMTLRFYPTFQSNWQSVRNSRKALGLESENSHWNQVKTASKEMPGLLVHQLRRADDVATAMKLRGYGNQFPRGVTHPIPFGRNQLFQMIAITLFYWGIHSIAAF
ncbi:MAG: energy-coupling factor transporter transmembrane protein EcfT [Candidatus Marinimicrobia bacterium]|nr:energy-coupling factor transporter transmembrane protein EcfT [Candidatus Neomarinimicrobiota bacterium]MBL7009793.1 energy-coupling factor transporter transmembrane protein EcfT [Candidatus Neomarinimicrobiota bacterium]MBL7029803.1 energy-coupling factor transporter transmembrane protein EcfT [Candidatus Neomarinimicrobiota bacterium]